MRIINSNNPAHGFADFVLVCDYCGQRIGQEDANLEFYDQGEAFCLHKYCSDAFRKQNKAGRLYWVNFEGASITVKEAGQTHTIKL